MPLIHHNVVRELLPRVKITRVNDIGPVAHERFSIPLFPHLLEAPKLAPMHVARVFSPRVSFRIHEHTVDPIAPASLNAFRISAASDSISRSRRSARCAQTLCSRSSKPFKILVNAITHTTRLRPNLTKQLDGLGIRVVIKTPC
jgi:hypothetical protein